MFIKVRVDMIFFYGKLMSARMKEKTRAVLGLRTWIMRGSEGRTQSTERACIRPFHPRSKGPHMLMAGGEDESMQHFRKKVVWLSVFWYVCGDGNPSSFNWKGCNMFGHQAYSYTDYNWFQTSILAQISSDSSLYRGSDRKNRNRNSSINGLMYIVISNEKTRLKAPL